MLRPTSPDDTSALVRLAEATAFFKPHEIEALEEVLADYHAVNHGYGHRAVTLTDDAKVILGFAYFAPTAMTDRTWELWWLAVEPAVQGQGHGRTLLEHFEAAVHADGGRLMLIETSGTPLYAGTRGFYLKAGYVVAAEIADFYADGDAKVIYSKRPSPLVC